MKNTILIVLLIILGTSCETKKPYKIGSYVKHIQSNCVGIVDFFDEYSDTYLVYDYVCRVIENDKVEVLKKSVIEVHHDLLEPTGLLKDDNTIKQYIKDLYKIIKAKQNENNNTNNTDSK